ncbi:PREDICTED: uncharacterized protein LOC106807892 [Priapulus caudatus]|uniref:Uncharacterized protein LOC106807892 n=1 Tax=Priapulus caudatus TaxID=37621 RepID=A0ABM1E114_PRICU|nr:PREDICTED: uncharacterized protein LOC106807892 [Priapulus caudatus]
MVILKSYEKTVSTFTPHGKSGISGCDFDTVQSYTSIFLSHSFKLKDWNQLRPLPNYGKEQALNLSQKVSCTHDSDLLDIGREHFIYKNLPGLCRKCSTRKPMKHDVLEFIHLKERSSASKVMAADAEENVRQENFGHNTRIRHFCTSSTTFVAPTSSERQMSFSSESDLLHKRAKHKDLHRENKDLSFSGDVTASDSNRGQNNPTCCQMATHHKDVSMPTRKRMIVDESSTHDTHPVCSTSLPATIRASESDYRVTRCDVDSPGVLVEEADIEVKHCPLCQQKFTADMTMLDIDNHVATCVAQSLDDESDVRSCPICNMKFTTGISQVDADGHIALCLSENAVKCIVICVSLHDSANIGCVMYFV